MRLSIILIILSLSIVACDPSVNDDVLSESYSDVGIVGGRFAKPEESIAKSTALLLVIQKETQELLGTCTATAISRNILVTAAHCLQMRKKPGFTPVYVAHFGDFDFVDQSKLKKERLIGVESMVAHPKHVMVADEVLPFDIGILKLKKEIPPGFAPAVIFKGKLDAGKKVVVAGFGRISVTTQTINGLLKVYEGYKVNYTTSTLVKLHGVQGEGAYRGDSGGPAYVLDKNQAQVWGVFSTSSKDQYNEILGPATYVDMRTHSDWIQKATKSLGGEYIE